MSSHFKYGCYWLIMITTVVAFACSKKVATQQKEVTYGPALDTAGLGFLQQASGTYPGESRIFDDAGLQARLRNLLKADFGYFMNAWKQEVPCEIRDGLFYTSGTQTRESNDPGAVFMADLDKNILYVAIRRNGQVRMYSEDGSQPPARLVEWVNQP